MMHDDAYDEAKEGFGHPVISDEVVASLKAELDKPEMITYTEPAIAPQEQKVPDTKMAATAEPKAKVDNSKIRELDPKLIKIEEGFNARDFDTKANKEHVKELAASIKEVGVLESLTVRYDAKTSEYYLVNGESRLRATLLAIEGGAPIKSVPVNFERKGTSTEDRIATLITRNEGKKLEVLEQAEVFSRLSNLGWADLQIAKKTGKTGPFVGSVLKLAAAPAKLKKLISDGQVSASLAIDILRAQEFDYDKAYEALSDAVATAASLGGKKATAKHVDPAKGKKESSTSSTPLHFQRGCVNEFINVLAAIAADTSLHRGTRTKAKNVLENADVDYKEWMKSNEPEEEE
jgi:ParB/RepB/Spo0J family partition protein